MGGVDFNCPFFKGAGEFFYKVSFGFFGGCSAHVEMFKVKQEVWEKEGGGDSPRGGKLSCRVIFWSKKKKKRGVSGVDLVGKGKKMKQRKERHNRQGAVRTVLPANQSQERGSSIKFPRDRAGTTKKLHCGQKSRCELNSRRNTRIETGKVKGKELGTKKSPKIGTRTEEKRWEAKGLRIEKKKWSTLGEETEKEWHFLE